MSDDTALIAGIQKYLPNATFFIDGQSTSVSEVVATVQGRVDADNAVLTAEAAFHGAVETGRTTLASTDAYVTAVRQQVLAMVASPPAQAELHVSPRKRPAPRTVEQKVVAAAKAKATREARGTKGPKARLEITGTVQSPIVIAVPPVGSVVPANPVTNGATPHA